MREEDINPEFLAATCFGDDRKGLPIILNRTFKSDIRKSAGVSEGDYVSMVQESQAFRQEYLNSIRGD